MVNSAEVGEYLIHYNEGDQAHGLYRQNTEAFLHSLGNHEIPVAVKNMRLIA